MARAIQHANRILDWQENMRSDEIPPVWMWCLPPQQNVISVKGIPVPMGDEPSIALSGAGKFQSVLKHWRRSGTEKILELDVQGLPDTVRLTPNHHVLARGADGVSCMIPAGELRPWSHSYDKSTGLYGSGHMLATPRRALAKGGNYEDGWIVGLYLAEGHDVRYSKGRGWQLCFSIAASEGPIVAERLQSWVDHHPYVPSRGRCKPVSWKFANQKRTGVRVQVGHRPLYELVADWVEGKSALDKCLQDLPTERDFAEGLLDGWLWGDGTNTNQGRSGTTFSENLAWQMFQLAHDLGYTPGLSRATNCGFSSNDYWVVAVNAVHGTGAPLDAGSLVWRRVRSINASNYEGVLCDMEVDCDHTYIAGGVVVSNSHEDELKIWFEEVDRLRKEKYGGGSETPDVSSGPMTGNELTKQFLTE